MGCLSRQETAISNASHGTANASHGAADASYVVADASCRAVDESRVCCFSQGSDLVMQDCNISSSTGILANEEVISPAVGHLTSPAVGHAQRSQHQLPCQGATMTVGGHLVHEILRTQQQAGMGCHSGSGIGIEGGEPLIEQTLVRSCESHGIAIFTELGGSQGALRPASSLLPPLRLDRNDLSARWC